MTESRTPGVINSDHGREDVTKWHFEQLAKKAIASLKANCIEAVYVPDREHALATILDMIPEGVSVGRGDSITIRQIGILDELQRRNRNKIIDPFPERMNGDDPSIAHYSIEERYEVMRQALLADVFLSGTNAITLDGKLVNTDGLGN